MNMNVDTLIHNRFDIEVKDVNTGKVRQKVVAYNIVLDALYSKLCAGSTYFVNIHFGTGTGTLDPTRTSLFTHLGTKTAVNDAFSYAMPVSSGRKKIVLNPEEFVGSTITEVGIAYSSTAANLVTHAMLEDIEGNPISITKTATDLITIYATVFATVILPTGVTICNLSDNYLVKYLIGEANSYPLS